MYASKGYAVIVAFNVDVEDQEEAEEIVSRMLDSIDPMHEKVSTEMLETEDTLIPHPVSESEELDVANGLWNNR